MNCKRRFGQNPFIWNRRNSFPLNPVKQAKQNETCLLHYHFGIFLRNFNEFNPIISMGNKSIWRKMLKKLIPLLNLDERSDAFAGILPFPEDFQASSDRSAFFGGLTESEIVLKKHTPNLRGKDLLRLRRSVKGSSTGLTC
jgi:hypothetical protein